MIFNTSSTIIQSVKTKLFCQSPSLLPTYLVEAVGHMSDVIVYELGDDVLSNIPASGALVWSEKRLTYFWPEKAVNPIYFDFDEWVEILLKTGYKSSLLLRAVGKKKADVIDSTTGTARDSLTLLLGGHRVQSWERDPVVYLLLLDAYEHMANPYINKSVWTLFYGDVFKTENQASVLYYDPMFDRTGKTALARKEMMLFHQILDEDQSSEELIRTRWMKKNVKRLIVKRPLKGNSLELPVTAQYKGKSVRFDLHQLG